MMQRFIRFSLAALTAVSVSFAASSSSAAPAKKHTAAPAAAPAKPIGISKNPYLGAMVVDATTGRILFEDHADTKGYPASVLKLMDMLIIIEKIEQGQLSLTNQVVVSKRSAKTGGSQVYLAEKESFTVDEMLYALMIKSANDAAVALAEHVGGSVEGFVDLMNRRARELGMNNTVFYSVHGLPPGVGQLPDETTARDLAILCRELCKHPDVLRYTSTRKRTFRPEGTKGAIVMENHDHLLGSVAGCDGFKTGYYTRAGYSIALTAARNGQRVIAIVLDSSDRKLRDAKATELINKGFVTLASQPAPAPTPAPVPAAAAAPAAASGPIQVPTLPSIRK